DRLEHPAELVRQPAQRLLPPDEGLELAGVRQPAVQKEIRDFLERRVLREIVDVVAAIGEPGALLADRAQRRLAGGDAREPPGFRLRCRHFGSPSPCVLPCPAPCSAKSLSSFSSKAW